MKRIDRKALAATAAERWKALYQDTPLHWSDSTSRAWLVYRALKRLGDSPDPDQVDRVIGNDSWTCMWPCSECGRRVGEVIIVGEDSMGSGWGHSGLCRECLLKALMLIDQ